MMQALLFNKRPISQSKLEEFAKQATESSSFNKFTNPTGQALSNLVYI